MAAGNPPAAFLVWRRRLLTTSHADKHVVIAANGSYAHDKRLLSCVGGADLIIAADGGANWLVQHGITPDVLIGDLDSVADQVLADLEGGACRIERYSPNKDETDTELALLEAVALGATRITLVGVLGGRVDHELANTLLLLMPQLDGLDVTIYDGKSYLCLVKGERTLAGAVGDTLSLIPLGGDVLGIMTSGLQYPLRNEPLYVGPARGVSNVFTAPHVRVACRQGTLLAVHTPLDTMPENER